MEPIFFTGLKGKEIIEKIFKDMDKVKVKAKVEAPTDLALKANKEWREWNKTLNRQRKYGSVVITSKVYMFGQRNRPIIATLPNGDKIVSNYKNLEKAGLTHVRSEDEQGGVTKQS